MERKPAAQLPDVSGIDLDYRPRNYFWAADMKVHCRQALLARPAGNWFALW